MLRILFCLVLFVGTTGFVEPANAAIVLIDDFQDPAVGGTTHNSASGGNLRNIPLNAGSATTRNLIGPSSPLPALAVSNGDLSAIMLVPGGTASLIWEVASDDLLGPLVLTDFAHSSGTGTYEVFANGNGTAGTGTSLGSGVLPTSSGTTALNNAGFNGLTRLELMFTADNTLAFDVSSVTATPEPASLSLLGLSMLGALGYRRKRKTVVV